MREHLKGDGGWVMLANYDFIRLLCRFLAKLKDVLPYDLDRHAPDDDAQHTRSHSNIVICVLH